MTIFDENNNQVRLVPYSEKRNDTALKKRYLKWLNDPEITISLASPNLLTTDKKISFIEESFERFTDENCKGYFIEFIPDNKFIGTAKLDSICYHNLSAWDGIMIGDKRYHRKGLAPQVYKILLAFAFLELKLNRISGGCNSKNIAMIKTFEKIGYTKEGTLRNADFINNEYSDHLYFGILRDEFLKKNKIKLKVDG